MKRTVKAWAVVWPGEFLWTHSVRDTKQACVDAFIKDTGIPWAFWRDKQGLAAIRVAVTYDDNRRAPRSKRVRAK